MTAGYMGKALSLIIAAVIMVTIIPFTAFASSTQDVIIVGANPSFGITKNGSSYSGVGYDYLEEISKTTGQRFTYVEGTPAELFSMLADGRIDIIPCVTEEECSLYTKLAEGDLQEIMEQVPAAQEPMEQESQDDLQSEQLIEVFGYSMAAKYAAVYISDNGGETIYASDVQTLNKARIGYLAEDGDKFFVNGKFKYSEIEDAQFILYNTESQMKADFVSGKVDAVVKDCFRAWGDEAIAYSFSASPCCFAVSSDNTSLKAMITEAVGQIFIENPNFAGEAYDENVNRYGMARYAFTQTESEYIEKKQTLNLAFNTASSDILQIAGEISGSVIGLTDTTLSRLEELLGMSINVINCPNLVECINLVESGEADVIFGGVNPDDLAEYSGYYISSPLTREPIVIAGKSTASVNGYVKVAVPFYSDDITSYISTLYPGATFLPYQNIRLCLKAVMDGEADIACAGAYEVIYMKHNGFEDIAILDVCNAYHTECMAVSSDNTVLCGIIDKALLQISDNYIATEIYETMVTYGYDAIEASDIMNKLVWVFVALSVFAIAGVVTLAAVMRRRSRRIENVDPLTGGRTKKKFIEDFARLIKKTSPHGWALILIDIEKFKYINDRLGYEEGNRILERLYKVLGDHMADEEIFARISDDVFACAIHNGSDNELSLRMYDVFAEFERRNSLFVKYNVLFSAGICRLGEFEQKNGTVDVNAALDRCAIAKKTVKGRHSHSIAFYDDTMRDKTLREKDYESLMPTALAEHEFQCYLQPKYGLKSLHIEGAEALIRWNSKEFGFVFPNDFIPLSEKNGFVVELDFFILEEVCKAMRRWIDSGKTPVIVSVNQSRLHLNNDDYIWRLREIVDKYDIPYKYIELELTESVFTENADLLLKIMQKLHDIGFRLSIDDFGSGYSSLNMLKDMPADVVKIDREFFSETVNSEKGRTVISTVVDLAKNLNMEVISEGVEIEDQVRFLSEINCEMVQGYYFAKPMTIPAFEELWERDLAKAAQEREQEQAQESVQE